MFSLQRFLLNPCKVLGAMSGHGKHLDGLLCSPIHSHPIRGDHYIMGTPKTPPSSAPQHVDSWYVRMACFVRVSKATHAQLAFFMPFVGPRVRASSTVRSDDGTILFGAPNGPTPSGSVV